MMAPGAGFCGGTRYRSKNRCRPKKQKKRSSLQNKLVFSPKVCDDQEKKKQKKTNNMWVFGLEKKNKHVKWCHPKMVTPGAGRPPLATPLVFELSNLLY